MNRRDAEAQRFLFGSRDDGQAGGPARSVEDASTGIRLTRRTFLKSAGALAATVGLRGNPGLVLPPLANVTSVLIPTPTLTFSLSVVRPRDLLVIRFEFFNLELKIDSRAGARLVRQSLIKDAYVVVVLPPQHIAEQAFWQNADGSGDPLAVPPVGSRLAGETRLAFKVPGSLQSIPYRLEDLLTWTSFEPSVAPTALPATPLVPLPGLGIAAADKPPLVAPKDYETAIELPWRLILSPSRYGGWAHALAPVTSGDRTELWHTRLGVLKDDGTIDEEAIAQRAVRAIWARPFDQNEPNKPPEPVELGPFRTSLSPNERWQIVHLTADHTTAGVDTRPLQVGRLMLTSLGAWMDARGAWATPPANTPASTTLKLDLTEWRHRATMGRDHYVRVVHAGYLFPFGHQAAYIKVTERKFELNPKGQKTAYLRQRGFIVVRQPEKTYPAPGQPHDGRQLPFKRVRITTLVTPDLNPPEDSDLYDKGPALFWPQVTRDGKPKDVLFQLVGVDGEGQRAEFTAPLLFVGHGIATDPSYWDMFGPLVMYGGPTDRRQRPFAGQKIAYAEAAKPGDTTLETASITFGATGPASQPPASADQPLFYPIVSEASVRLPAVEQIGAKSSGAESGQSLPVIKLHQKYLEAGFDPDQNVGAVFAELKNAMGVDFPADKVGGLITPNLNLNGLSRALGPVGDVANLAAGTFDPAQFFAGVEAKILGAIDLKEIIGKLLPAELKQEVQELASATPEMPKIPKIPGLTRRVIYPNDDKLALPEAVEFRYFWKPKVPTNSVDPTKGVDALGVFVPNNKTELTLTATLLARLNSPAEPIYEVLGVLTNFKLDLVGSVKSFLYLTFDRLAFTMKNGQKPDVDVDIQKVEFAGELEFVKRLQDFLKTGAAPGSGAAGLTVAADQEPVPAVNGVEVTSNGIVAGFSIGLPQIAVGVFSLQNVVLSSALELPFDGDPARIRFAFSERENPFLLTVSMFGGGGYFALTLGLDGVDELDAMLEFGGNFAFDVGFASGGVYIMAGIYFHASANSLLFEGHLRLGGAVSVLGIVSVSIELYMGLSYDAEEKKAKGQATLKIAVEIAFFSQSFEQSIERKFGGSANEDPTFEQLVTPDDWNDYCDAFAA